MFWEGAGPGFSLQWDPHWDAAGSGRPLGLKEWGWTLAHLSPPGRCTGNLQEGMNLPSPCISGVWTWLDPHPQAAPSIPGVHPSPHSHCVLGSPMRILLGWVSRCPDTPLHPDPACEEAAAPCPLHPPRWAPCSQLASLLIMPTLPAGSRRRCLLSAEVKGTLGYGGTRGGSPVCR